MSVTGWFPVLYGRDARQCKFRAKAVGDPNLDSARILAFMEGMAFLPREFEAPETVVADRFKLQVLSIHVVVKDYDAVMSSRKELWARFGMVWGWPPEDLTLEQDLIDLAWHQKEFQLGRAFAYSVMSPDDRQLLGCVYIDPTEEDGYDAEVFYWVRSSELESGMEDCLGSFVRVWLREAWPFRKVLFPGRRNGPG